MKQLIYQLLAIEGIILYIERGENLIQHTENAEIFSSSFTEMYFFEDGAVK